MSTRPRYVQDARDDRLREMWGLMSCSVIAKKLGYSNGSNVSHRAKHLGLPSLNGAAYREGQRNIRAAHKANAEARKRANAERRRELRGSRPVLEANRQRATGIQRNKPGAKEPQPVDRPVCFVCGGKSQEWSGHPQCRGRAAA